MYTSLDLKLSPPTRVYHYEIINLQFHFWGCHLLHKFSPSFSAAHILLVQFSPSILCSIFQLNFSHFVTCLDQNQEDCLPVNVPRPELLFQFLGWPSFELFDRRQPRLSNELHNLTSISHGHRIWKLNKNGYERLRTVRNDCERLRTIMNS